MRKRGEETVKHRKRTVNVDVLRIFKKSGRMGKGGLHDSAKVIALVIVPNFGSLIVICVI
jgi:hypothetical protein